MVKFTVCILGVLLPEPPKNLPRRGGAFEPTGFTGLPRRLVSYFPLHPEERTVRFAIAAMAALMVIASVAVALDKGKNEHVGPVEGSSWGVIKALYR